MVSTEGQKDGYDDFSSFHRPTEPIETQQAQEAKDDDKADELEEDPPVQGPLPYEPEDAPWKKTRERSGVRRL